MKRKISRALVKWGKKASRRNDYPFLKEHLMQVPEGAVVLNIGSGGGFDEIVREVARQRKFTVKSSDVDPSRNPDVVDDICESGLESDSIDAIVMASVIEHVQRPFDAAREIDRILKPGGSALFIIPFMFPIHDRPHDYFRFTEYGVRHLFAHMDIADMRPRDNWLEALLLAAARIAYEPGKASRMGIVIVPLCALLFPLASLIRLGPWLHHLGLYDEGGQARPAKRFRGRSAWPPPTDLPLPGDPFRERRCSPT